MADVTFHHVGILLPSRADVERYTHDLGLPVDSDEYVPDFDCDCIFLGSAAGWVELVIPRSGPLAQFNAGAGGLHHAAFRVSDLDRFMKESFAGKGRWLYPSPRAGARRMRVNFLAARHLLCLTEFVEEAA